MKTLTLTPATRINAITVVNLKKPNVAMSKDMNMTLLEWVMMYSMSDEALVFGPLPNLLTMKFKYFCDGSNGTHKMSAFIHENTDYKVMINVFDK
jgi:hypothetical protein